MKNYKFTTNVHRSVCLTVTVLAAVALTGCKSNALEANALNYPAIDDFSKKIYSQLVTSLKDSAFVGKVQTGLAATPAKYTDMVMANIKDGDYQIGGVTYHNILASMKHAPDIKSNMAAFAKAHPNMGKLFQANGLKSDASITASDVKQYFRFTADFLAVGGFSGHYENLAQKYPFADLVRVMRTGVFLTQLPAGKGIKLVGGEFGLDGNSGSSNNGAGASGAANFAGQFEITTRQSMTGQESYQCGIPRSGPCMAKVNGKDIPVAGVDGATLGTTGDAKTGSDYTSSDPGTRGTCGKCFSYNSKQYVVADRIWENDGPGGSKYGNKADADKKSNGTGSGSRQIDLAKQSGESNAKIDAGKVSFGSCN